jgi:type IVB pilus formation R64 PilN family outer membrane protein
MAKCLSNISANRSSIQLAALAVAGVVGITGCANKAIDQRARTETDARGKIIAEATTPLVKTAEDVRQLQGSAADLQQRAAAQQKPQVVRHATKPWFGARSIQIQSDEVLPPAFLQNADLKFEDLGTRGRVSISVVAERLSRLTGIPVRVKGDVFSGAGAVQSAAAPAMEQPMAQKPSPMPVGVPGGQGVAPQPFQPYGVAPASAAPVPVTDVNAVEMRWNGTYAGFLDYVTARLGVSWSYRDGVVMIERYVTETLELAAVDGIQNYKFTLSGSSSGTSGQGGAGASSASGLDVNESGKLEVLKSLTSTIKEMLASTIGSSVVLSEGTGRLVVTTTKDSMSRVRDVVQRENAALLRTVALQIDIYAVSHDDTAESGVNWNLVFNSLSQKYGASFASPTSLTGATAGAITATILQNSNSNANKMWGGTSAVLSAMAEYNYATQHRPLTMMAMNRQWARKTNLIQTGYLQETTPAPASSAGAGGLPGLKTGTVTTGDTFVAMPAILDNGTVILKFGVGLTDLLGLFDVTTGSGTTFQKVQTPNVSGTNDQISVPIKPGQAVVLTGMSRLIANGDQRTLSENTPAGIGGSKKNTHKREEFMVIVRPVLM